MAERRTKLTSLRVPQLNYLLREYGITATGNKAQKVAELAEHLGADVIPEEEVPAVDNAGEEVRNEVHALTDMVKQLAAAMNTLTQNIQTITTQVATTTVQSPEVVITANQRSDEQDTRMSVRACTVREIVEALPEYDPLRKNMTSQQFFQKVKQLQRAYNWSDEVTVFAAQQRLRGVAKQWLDAQPVCTTMDAFEAAFMHDFPTQANSAECHKRMIKCKRKFNQSYLQYYYEMLSTGRRGGLDDPSIVMHIIEGINDATLTKTLLAMNITTCTSLLASLENLETKTSHTETAETTIKQEGGQAKLSKSKCFNCNEAGHLARQCPKPQRKQRCGKCGKIGHEASACRGSINAVAHWRKCEGIPVKTEKKCPAVVKKVAIQGKHYDAFIDTGSEYTLIAETMVPPNAKRESKLTVMQGFGGAVVESKECFRTEMVVDGCKTSANILIVEDDLMPHDLLIGRDVLQQTGFKLTIESGVLQIKRSQDSQAEVGEGIPEEKREQLAALLSHYDDCFAEDLSKLGRCNFTEMDIKVTTDRPIVGKRYSVPLAHRSTLSTIIGSLLSHNIIRPSVSPHAAPVVLVKKANGEDRMCIDFRSLNAVTVKQQYPMPIIEEQLAKLNGKNFFSILDMTAGYYQIPLTHDSKQYTAFMTPDGLFEHNVMPFGLVNAPMKFQEMMMTLIRSLNNRKKIISYVDEVVIASEKIDEGMQVLEEFLSAMRRAGLTLRPSKCVFMASTVSFLGHVVSKGQIRPGEKKTRCISEFPRPRNVTEVRQFLGLTGFFRKFIHNYGTIAKPITALLKRDAKFVWTGEQEEAFKKLKLALTEDPVLVMFNPDANHQVHTDASAVGLSGVLMQLEEKEWKPVQYFSRQCSAVESTYPSHELEVLAVVEALERFRVYLIGKHFEVITDCNAIATTKTTTQLKPRIARWWLRLQEFDFETKHRAGVKMPHVDALSRLPVEEAEDPVTIADKVLRVDRMVETEDWVYSMQMQDDKLRGVTDILTGKTVVDVSLKKQTETDYTLQNGRLYRKVGSECKLVVPRAVRWRVTKACHDDVGHFAIEKTVQRISRYFWFPRIRRYVKSYISACDECCINKARGGKTQSELHLREVWPIPFRHIFVDHMGPFMRSKRGNSFLLVVVCGFSKYVLLKPVRTTKTEPVIRALEEVMSIFGQPVRITTDRGTAFTSQQFKTFITRYGIQHNQTAVRTPRANGQVERANKTVLSSLKCLVTDKREWDTHLLVIQWALNSQRNEVTKFTPNELVLQYSPRDMTQNRLIQAVHDNNQPIPDARKNNEAALENIRREQQRWKARYDKMHQKPRKYEPGDLVLLENVPGATGQSRKLEPPYKGPYVIAKCLDYDRYLVETLPDVEKDGRTYSSVHSVDHLRPWCALTPSLDADEGESSGSDEESGAAEL